MEELGSEVDAGDVGGDVIDQFSVGVNMPSTSGEGESLVVDRGDHSSAEQDTGTHGTVVKVVQGERGQCLKEEETEGITYAFGDRRRDLSSAVGNVGTLGKFD